MASKSPDADGSGCFVCSKHLLGEEAQGGVIYQDHLLYAGHCHLLGQPDILLGWVVVEPRRHLAELGDLSFDEASSLGVLVARLARAVQQSEGAEHIYSYVGGDGLGAGHLHVHLIPRYRGSPPEYKGLRATEWSGAPRGGAVEMTAVAQRIRHQLLTG